jgi:hypothetical protein
MSSTPEKQRTDPIEGSENMSLSRHVWRGAAAPIVALALACGSETQDQENAVVSEGTADADYPSIFPGNRSDPAAAVYNNTLYVYTSSDLGNNTNSSLFPMNTTYVQSLAAGRNPGSASDWTSAAAFDESKILGQPGWFWDQGAPKHLWAPESFQFAGDSRYWLFVPDVESSDPKSNSWIVAAYSWNPTGPFTYYGWVYWAGDPSTNVMPYASDPGPAQGPDGTKYLVIANGDGSNCGGLTLLKLGTDANGAPVNAIQKGTIYVTGLPAADSDPNRCTTGKSAQDKTDHPNPGDEYLEGASLYYLPDATIGGGVKSAGPWYLIFPRKPGNRNQVLSYATASSLTATGGPGANYVRFTYRGDLLDASADSWTDQGSIVKWNNQWLLFYHDGVSNANHNRKTHFECIWFNNDGTIDKVKRTTSGAPTCAKPPLTAVTVNINTANPNAYAQLAYGNAKATAACRKSSGSSCTQYYAQQSYPAGFALYVYGYCPGGTFGSWTGCNSNLAPDGHQCALTLTTATKNVTMTCK